MVTFKNLVFLFNFIKKNECKFQFYTNSLIITNGRQTNNYYS